MQSRAGDRVATSVAWQARRQPLTPSRNRERERKGEGTTYQRELSTTHVRRQRTRTDTQTSRTCCPTCCSSLQKAHLACLHDAHGCFFEKGLGYLPRSSASTCPSQSELEEPGIPAIRGSPFRGTINPISSTSYQRRRTRYLSIQIIVIFIRRRTSVNLVIYQTDDARNRRDEGILARMAKRYRRNGTLLGPTWGVDA